MSNGISFNFQGWVTGAKVTQMLEVATFKIVDVSNKTDKEKVEMLKTGDYTISLSDYVSNFGESDVQISEFEVSE